MSTFTIIPDYRNGENNYKGPLLAYECGSQGVRNRPFLGKICRWNSHWEVPKHLKQDTKEKLDAWISRNY